MTNNPLDFELNDAMSGDTDAMKEIWLSLAEFLSSDSPISNERKQYLSLKINEACACYSAGGEPNKVYSKICDALGFKRRHGRQTSRGDNELRLYNCILKRMEGGVSGKRIGYKKAIDLLFQEKWSALNFVQNTTPENVQRIYKKYRKAQDIYNDA